MRRIGGILGRSPFGPTHEHMLKVVGCLKLIVPLADAFVALDEIRVRQLSSDIKRLEVEADEVKKAIRAQFTVSPLASVARSEVLALVKAQDDVADQCERLSYELSLRGTKVPSFLAGEIRALAAAVAAAAGPLSSAARFLDESGGRLSRPDAENVSSIVAEVEHATAEVEPLADSLLRTLFQREGDVDVLDVIFLLRFAEGARKISGKTENIGDVLFRLITEVVR